MLVLHLKIEKTVLGGLTRRSRKHGDGNGQLSFQLNRVEYPFGQENDCIVIVSRTRTSGFLDTVYFEQLALFSRLKSQFQLQSAYNRRVYRNSTNIPTRIADSSAELLLMLWFFPAFIRIRS
jgi:hypothetical protein